MPASASNPQVPPNMSHYPPEILEKYLAAVEQERAKGEDSDEAVFSDTDEAIDDDDGDDDDEKDVKSQHNAIDLVAAQMQNMYIAAPSDTIQSDDSGFSSEDEYIDDNLRHDLHIRREIILGRPPAELQDWKLSKIVDYYLAYIKQLNDADIELDELLNLGGSASGAGGNGSRTRGANMGDSDAGLVELRNRTRAEIQTIDRDQLVRELVLLAQGLFRKEKKIKKIVEVQGMAISTSR